MSEEVMIEKGTDEVAKMQRYSDEDIVKTFIIKEAEKGSQQILLEDEFQELYESKEVVEPLYDPLLWATLMEKNTRLAKLIRTYARNTVGLGWGIYPKKAITKDTTDQEKAQIDKEIELLEEVFEYPNEDLPFSEIMYQVKVDEESTGNGYLEISRNLKGDIDGLYHIPAHTMRILKNLKGFVQIRGGVRRYFKKFGEPQDIDAYGGKWGSMPYDKRGNEIIHFKVYTPRDSFYGVPRYVAAADAIAGNKLAARRNLAFFKNDATPRLAVTVENGKLDGSSINEIKKFVNTEGKGVENAHRAMILQATSKANPGQDAKDVRINVQPLTVGVSDDASHIKYRTANDEELREAFGIAEVFLGAKGTVNRATAMVSRDITNNQEFIPDAQVKEYKINATICKAFGVKKVKLEFERPSNTDELGQAEIFARYLQGGGVTPNDIRHELGKPEYNFDWADMPIQLAMIQYQMQILGDQGAVAEGGDPKGNYDEPKDGEEDPKEEEVDNNEAGEEEGDKKAKTSKAIQKMVNDDIQMWTRQMIENTTKGEKVFE